MSKVRVLGFSVSLDGYGAGPEQSLEHPFGKGGMELPQWLMGTKTFNTMIGEQGGSTGVDDRYAAASLQGFGAFIIGRNMFGPLRGEWPDENWKGWWGTNPPYHVPVFVLTNYARAPLTMEGGTVFHFVTDGFEAALAKAKEAAQGKDIRVGGGVSTLKQYLKARLIDNLHLAVAPVLLGSGENLFSGIDFAALGYRITERVPTEKAVHLTVVRDD